MRLRYTTRALREIAHIQDLIAERSPRAAVEVTETIEQSLARLVTHPEMGRIGRVPGTRELVITGTPYLVAYRVDARSIAILAVLHGAQRWPDSL